MSIHSTSNQDEHNLNKNLDSINNEEKQVCEYINTILPTWKVTLHTATAAYVLVDDWAFPARNTLKGALKTTVRATLHGSVKTGRLFFLEVNQAHPLQSSN